MSSHSFIHRHQRFRDYLPRWAEPSKAISIRSLQCGKINLSDIKALLWLFHKQIISSAGFLAAGRFLWPSFLRLLPASLPVPGMSNASRMPKDLRILMGEYAGHSAEQGIIAVSE
jgi:hypothetical protein